jgi:DNA topoisomerase-1
VQNGRRREWRAISATDINAYLAQLAGPGYTAKDFRTWQGTVVAAGALGRYARTGDSSPAAVKAAVETAAEWLHNTPTVARQAYIDPRVIEMFEKGRVVAGRATDRTVLDLLT